MILTRLMVVYLLALVFMLGLVHAQDQNNAEPSTMYHVETEKCVCVAPKNFSNGEQINIFYGERSNADFLVHNGFVYPENHHDVVKVKFGIPNSDTCSLRLELLKKLKLPPSGEYAIKADQHNPIHSSVLSFVRIFKMTQDELREWLDREDAERVLFGPIGSMSADRDGGVLQYILTRISILLKAYPTTLEQDEQLLQQVDLKRIRRLVIRHRITEKKILSEAVTFCKMKIAEIDLQKIAVTEKMPH